MEAPLTEYTKGPEKPRSSSEAVAQQNPRSSSEAVAQQNPPNPVEDLIVDLLTQPRNTDSLSPNQVARAINEENWRRQLPQVRAALLALEREGRIEAVRKGRVVPLEGIKGIYRFRLVKEVSA